MAQAHAFQKAAIRKTLEQILKYIDKDPDANLVKLVNRGSTLFKGVFPKQNFEAFKKRLPIRTTFGANMS